ncbi:sugar phosphate isomerase/epimerase family protein [Thiomicrorhabdus chilensis]|uniref:sugar phosphate isomerase/epimerase family protein n=1 Tax=Thiomicrorhabdus chilensis TaxID=63656 RepID=UPI00040A1FCB|nr:TIM barrel protein [Thiomicrorhabdus chilensis]
MKLKIFKALWGCDLPIEQAVAQAVHAGFQGIEGRAPQDSREQKKWSALFEQACLDYVAEIVTGGDYVPHASATPEQHLADLKLGLENSMPLNPKFATCITGYDAWPESESIDFFKAAIELAQTYGLPINFETHRSRSLFNPWVTRRIAEAIPEMRLTLDISHWCVVCERLMDSEISVLESFLPQVRHIHARVGYDQGPQVPHPAAPEYAAALLSHQTIWARVWQLQKQSGQTCTSMTPEFGPDGYLHRLPFTQAPIADLWEINQWMAETERAHFQRFSN